MTVLATGIGLKIVQYRHLNRAVLDKASGITFENCGDVNDVTLVETTPPGYWLASSRSTSCLSCGGNKEADYTKKEKRQTRLCTFTPDYIVYTKLY